MAHTHYGLAKLGASQAENRKKAIEHSLKAERLIPVDEPENEKDKFLRKEARPDGFDSKGNPISIEVSVYECVLSRGEYYRIKGSSSEVIHRVPLPKSIMKPLGSSGIGTNRNLNGYRTRV